MTPKSLIEPARHAGTALLRSQTDARLVDLTRDGNERAFEAIVQRYRRPLLRYCSRLLPPTRAEDAVQHAFLSAHRAIHAGGAELNLRPWLYRIAHNASLNLLRQHGFDHDQVSEEIDGVETPPQAFERGERLRTVVAAVQDLPDRQRSAIVLQALEGRSYDEIAVELGVSDGAVRQLLNRARNTLREAAAALTPTGLITRIASSGGEASVADRVAQALAGAGGGALVAKAGAALVVAGAVAGGAAVGGLPGGATHHRNGGGGSAHVAAAAPGTAGVSPGAVPRESVQFTSRTGGAPSAGSGNGGGDSGVQGHGGATGRHGGSGSSSGGGSGEGHHGGGSGDDHSGSGSSGGSGDDHSGSGDSGSGGGDHSGSGSGSGDSGSGDSGSVPSADDSSDSGSSGSGSSGSGTSGSGTSGSGTSGSGSDDAAPTTSDDLTDGSGRERSGGDDSPTDPPSGTSGTSGSSH
jgi:RNA polymerase sigma factor (sigma-70 family)